MAKSGALDLAIGVGGKIKKEEVESAVETYEKYHVQFGGDEETRKTNYSDMVNNYYDLATSFYEFGWGESFHFAPRWKGESLKESIKRHEHFLALQLGLKSGMKLASPPILAIWSRVSFGIQDAYAEAASIAEQAITYIRTLYAFTNDTLAKYSHATSLQATLRYGILISLVQGLGLGFTYGLAICSCALQLWVGRFLVLHAKANGGEIITALFSVILSGLGLNQAATNFYSFEQGRIAAYRLYEMISRSASTINPSFCARKH